MKYLQQQIQERLAEFVDTIREVKGFGLILPELDPPVFDVTTEGCPSKGATSPDVTVVEFSDFQCPYCKMATGAVDNLLEHLMSQSSAEPLCSVSAHSVVGRQTQRHQRHRAPGRGRHLGGTDHLFRPLKTDSEPVRT